MGNQSNKYSLEKFITEFDTSSINSMEQKEIKEKLEGVLNLFKQDKNYYTNLKNDKNSSFYEKRETKENFVKLDEVEVDSEKTMKKSWKFCNLITFSIKINFTNREIYVIILDIFSYLSKYHNSNLFIILVKESEFLNFFMKNSLEELCNMIQVNELKQSLIFYQKVLKLFKDMTEYINSGHNLILENLTGLRKMSSVAKMLIDTTFCKDKEIKTTLLYFLKQILVMLKTLYDKYRNELPTTKNKEYLSIVKLTIHEYYNSTLFSRMSEDLIKLDNTVTIEMQKIIIECFNLLAQFDFVVYDQLINSEKEVKNAFFTIYYKVSDDIIIETLKFLLNYFINSLNQECYGNFKLFQTNDENYEEKVFQMFLESKNDDIKFLICLIFFIISSIESIWTRLNNFNLIKSTSKFIKLFIADTFKKINFVENDITFQKKFQLIEILFKILSVITDDRNFVNIFHTDFFKTYFDVVVLLFHVYHPQYKIEILKAMNVFTYFGDCKHKALKTKNFQIINFFHLRISFIFKNLQRIYSIYESLLKRKEELIDENRKSLDAEFYNKIMENIQILENSSEESKKLFFKTLQEFGLLMSIFINLMMTNDYKNSKIILTQNNQNFFDDFKSKGEKNSSSKEDSEKFTLFDFETFFKDIDLLINELSNQGNYNFMSKYSVQIIIARLINNPTGKFEINKIRDNVDEKEEMDEIKNLELLYDYLKYYKTDYDILHKLLFVINRLLNHKRNHKMVIETVKKIFEEIKLFLYKDIKSSVTVNRECLRLLCTLTMFTDNTLLWLKFDSKKIHVDHSNYSDVLLKYKDEETDWDQDNPNKERIIFPPYLKVKSYADKMGVIFYGEHVLILPKKLHLGNAFTISFRFFNPVINSKNWHVLLQDPSGIGGLITIDCTKSKLGCFTIEGKFIDSGIDLNHSDYSKKWVHVAMTYGIKTGPKNKRKASYIENNEQRTLIWYINGTECKRYEKQKIILSQTIQYIGNSRDFDEPFGVFCDLRIYPILLNNTQIKRIFSNEDNLKNDKSDYDIMNYIYHKFLDQFILSYLETHDVTEETFYFTIKFLNNMMADKGYRDKFINYKLITKILSFYTSKKIEIKKEISKFMMTIS